MQPIQLNK